MTRRRSRSLTGLGAVFLAVCCTAQARETEDAKSALAAGRYADAILLFEKEREENPESPAAVLGLARALQTVGRYGDAQEALEEFLNTHDDSLVVANTLGEVLYAQGRVEAARTQFQRAVDGAAPDRLTAAVNLAVLLLERGHVEAAEKHFYSLIDAYNLSSELGAQDLAAVGRACRYLGVNDPQLFKDALRAYDEATARDPSNLESRIRLGELFLEKYNGTEARQTLETVLGANPQHPEALLAMARVLDFEGSPAALETTEKSLEVNPNLVPARVFRAHLLLKLEELDEAAAEAERALGVNPESLTALATLAAARYLQGDQEGFTAARSRALEGNPRNAEVYNTLADVMVYNRLYREAAEFARQAVTLDPKSWRGYGLLGLNELRLGNIEGGKAHLETSFAGDPYNVWIKNTLDLVDTFANYREVLSPRFRLVIEEQESEVLALYMAGLAEEAYDKLAKLYGYEPATPIRIEVYPSHADFSVRTVGLAGLGALGVSFGPVVALDSPSAREIGSFSWGSTLWHELAHTFTLGVTHNKIPRWLTEGISVLEEHRARPGWGDDVHPGFLQAFKDGKLLGLAEFNQGFVRPSFPEQIGFSYYQAFLVCQLIEQRWGHDSLVQMLQGYAGGRTTEEVFQDVLEMALDDFDTAFNAHLEERFAIPLGALRDTEEEEATVPSPENLAKLAQDDPGDFRSQFAYGLTLYREEKLDEALPYLERARALFPQFAGPTSPYPYLAKIYVEQGKPRKAVEELKALTAIDETHYEAHLELANLLQQLGDREGMAQALERMLYIYPLRIPIHTRLAEVYEELGQGDKAIRERAAVVALDPVDRADALYQLALAHFRAGQHDGARRNVLKALEIAPGFDAALELLLQLHGSGTGTGEVGAP